MNLCFLEPKPYGLLGLWYVVKTQGPKCPPARFSVACQCAALRWRPMETPSVFLSALAFCCQWWRARILQILTNGLLASSVNCLLGMSSIRITLISLNASESWQRAERKQHTLWWISWGHVGEDKLEHYLFAMCNCASTIFSRHVAMVTA